MVQFKEVLIAFSLQREQNSQFAFSLMAPEAQCRYEEKAEHDAKRKQCHKKLEDPTNESITMSAHLKPVSAGSYLSRAHSFPLKDQQAETLEKAASKVITPSVPNPAPLGLIAFGLTTALQQVKHTRLGGDNADVMKGVDTEMMGFAIFFGGLLQVSNCEFRTSDTDEHTWPICF